MAELLKAQREAIAAYAAICEVQDGIAGPFACPELDKIAHRIGKQSPWKDHMGEADLRRVVFWSLFRATRLIPPGYSGPLDQAPGGKEMVQDFQSSLVKYLESLPRTYNAYFPLVGMFELLKPELKLSDTVAIIEASPDKSSHTLLGGSNTALLHAMTRRPQPKLKRGARYLRVTVSGYTEGSSSSPASVQALAQLKHFLFFGLATGLLEELPSWEFSGVETSQDAPVSLISHESDVEDDTYVLELPDEFNRYLLRITVNKRRLEYYDTSGAKTVLGGKMREPITAEEIASTIQMKLSHFGNFLAIPRDDPDAVRVKAASEWWIEASASQNQTISFLQFCIGFEALLGDGSSERGVTERLADRFAYLLGRTQSQRAELKLKFRDVYDRRGSIVHQREPHLARDDRRARDQAKQMLSEAVVCEIKALMKAKKEMHTPRI